MQLTKSVLYFCLINIFIFCYYQMMLALERQAVTFPDFSGPILQMKVLTNNTDTIKS